jgi:hypothetical protein
MDSIDSSLQSSRAPLVPTRAQPTLHLGAPLVKLTNGDSTAGYRPMFTGLPTKSRRISLRRRDNGLHTNLVIVKNDGNEEQKGAYLTMDVKLGRALYSKRTASRFGALMMPETSEMSLQGKSSTCSEPR